MMAAKIFYSWQSDLDPEATRNFIEEALELSIKKLNAEIESAERPVNSEADDDDDPNQVALDMDTKGVTGSPKIADTIFGKISEAAAFVADMTFVGARNGGKGKISNPNVLIEYGYAVKALGDFAELRIISVMNTFYGKPSLKNLPFDMKYVRWPITYTLAPNATLEERETAQGG